MVINRFVMENEGKPVVKNEEGNSSPDFTDQEQELAHHAFLEFEGCHYDACLNFLSKLEDLRPKDMKVLHNKAVAEFYKSGCTRTEEFLKALQVIKKKVRFLKENIYS